MTRSQFLALLAAPFVTPLLPKKEAITVKAGSWISGTGYLIVRDVSGNEISRQDVGPMKMTLAEYQGFVNVVPKK